MSIFDDIVKMRMQFEAMDSRSLNGAAKDRRKRRKVLMDTETKARIESYLLNAQASLENSDRCLTFVVAALNELIAQPPAYRVVDTYGCDCSTCETIRKIQAEQAG